MPDSSSPVSGEPEQSPVSATNPPNFEESVTRLHEKADTVTKAEDAFKRAFVPFCEELYTFGKSHSRETITTWLSAKGLKVTAAANGWTPAVKLAFAVERDGKWTVNDQQVSKYTKVMEYAEREKVGVGKLDNWIGLRTFSDVLISARAKGTKVTRLEEDVIKAKIKEHTEALKEKWGPVLDGKTLEPIDMTDAPIGHGYVQIFAEVNDIGEVSIFGMKQAEPSTFLKLITPPPATMLDTSNLDKIGGVKELLKFGSFIPASSGPKGKITRGVVLLVEEDKWLFHAFKRPGQSSPIAAVIVDGGHTDIPPGAWFFSTHEQSAITSLLANFSPDNLKFSKNKDGELVLKLVDGEKGVQERIDEINATKKQKWLESTGKKAKEIPTFELPKPIANEARAMRMKDFSKEKVPQPKSEGFDEFTLPFSKGLRASIAEAIGKMTAEESVLRVRFEEKHLVLSSLVDGTRTQTASYGKAANKGLEKAYVVEKALLKDALDAMTLAVGDGACSLVFGKTMFGFLGVRDGTTFEVYIPQIEVGETYAPDEFNYATLSMPIA